MSIYYVLFSWLRYLNAKMLIVTCCISGQHQSVSSLCMLLWLHVENGWRKLSLWSNQPSFYQRTNFCSTSLQTTNYSLILRNRYYLLYCLILTWYLYYKWTFTIFGNPFKCCHHSHTFLCTNCIFFHSHFICFWSKACHVHLRFSLTKIVMAIRHIKTSFSGEYWSILYVLRHLLLIKGTTMKSGEIINILWVI